MIQKIKRRLARFLIMPASAFSLILGTAGPLFSESLSLTTTYPSPAGVYGQIITTGVGAGGAQVDTQLVTTQGNVGIGTGGSAPAYHLDLEDTSANVWAAYIMHNATAQAAGSRGGLQVFGWGSSAGGGASYGVYGSANAYGNGTAYAVYASANAVATGTGYGTYGYATGGSTNYGLYGMGAQGSATNYGVYATASGASSTNYGVYGTASAGTTNWAGYFVGNGYFSGNVGIGATVPAAQAHVQLGTLATATVNSLLIARWGRPINNGIKWPNTMDMLIGSYGTGINSQTRVDYKLGNGGTSSTDVTVMTLQGDGNVGIGTTAPVDTLDVSGAIRTYGSLVGTWNANEITFCDSSRADRYFIGTRGSLDSAGAPWRMYYYNGTSYYNPISVAPTALDAAIYTESLHDSSLYIHSDGNVGIDNGTGAPGANLKVNGCIAYNGGSVGTCLSDLRLKKNVVYMTNALDKITTLKPANFEFKDPGYGAGLQAGLIAQDVEKTLPKLVNTNKEGYKQVTYGNELEMLLIESVKELKAENDALRKDLSELRKDVRKGP